MSKKNKAYLQKKLEEAQQVLWKVKNIAGPQRGPFYNFQLQSAQAEVGKALNAILMDDDNE